MSDLGHTRHPRFEAEKTVETPAQPPMPDFYMPAMPPLGLITAIENWSRAWIRAWRRRRRLLRLLDYDDHMLDDMGHTRQDLLWAAHLPLKEDAHRILRQLREQRLNRW
ncbi:hypothetical protein [Litchfieldella rifensis]|uniref:DUF1127 domain-containing protein n=1 Tax=Litchfieldella rifensis TaxID=762643 RepID=A0ABV7LVY7_9GAMM